MAQINLIFFWGGLAMGMHPIGLMSNLIAISTQ